MVFCIKYKFSFLAAGEAVARPVSGSLIFEVFPPSGRALANGIFSWGIYFGYGLAFVLGIYMTNADVLGYGWRSVYVICSLPGIIIGIAIMLFLQDPKYNPYAPTNVQDASSTSDSSPSKGSSDSKAEDSTNQTATQQDVDFKTYLKTLFDSFFKNPTLLILLTAAWARHTAGYCWAYNTRLYYAEYYPGNYR